jgi:hypothetical protein
MRKLGRRPFLLSALALAACGGGLDTSSTFDAGPPPPPGPPDWPDAGPDNFGPPGRAEPVDCTDPTPTAPLSALVGFAHGAPTLPRLYSYTTKAQADGLRAGDPIFSKSTTDSGHPGYVFTVLKKRESLGDLVAKELASARFAKGRFAWPFLAGTRISPENYGDEILSFTFKPEALFVAFQAKSAGYRFYDAKGTEVSETTAMATPERIAAFLFLNDEQTRTVGTTGIACAGTIDVGLVYREFYLGNAGMVAEWSLGTQAIVDRIAAEVADLRAMAKELDCSKGRIGPSCDAVLSRWWRVGGSRTERLLGSMAFATPFGRSGLGAQDLSRLADDLESLRFAPNPLVVTP